MPLGSCHLQLCMLNLLYIRKQLTSGERQSKAFFHLVEGFLEKTWQLACLPQ